MSHAISFDTLQFVKKMKQAGMDEKLAEAQAEALAELSAQNVEHLATKADLRELELRIVIKFGALLATAVGILAAIIKL
ncbi:MAG: DUF1640 domain-containing protein [Burkholderiales bacterium]